MSIYDPVLSWFRGVLVDIVEDPDTLRLSTVREGGKDVVVATGSERCVASLVGRRAANVEAIRRIWLMRCRREGLRADLPVIRIESPASFRG